MCYEKNNADHRRALLALMMRYCLTAFAPEAPSLLVMRALRKLKESAFKHSLAIINAPLHFFSF